MPKVKIGGIMQTTGLAKVGVMAISDRPGIAGHILAALGDEGINVQFVVQCIDIQDHSHVVFCISQEELDQAEEILEQVRTELGAQQVIRRPNVALISIFGPDFRERPGIAGLMFSALGARGINILAISTSISTVTCIIEAARLKDAVAAIHDNFDLP